MKWLLILLVLIGCTSTTEPQDLSLKMETLIDVWLYTEDELPWIGSPSCGILRSDGTAKVISPDDDVMGPVDWTSTGAYKVELSYESLILGTLEFTETTIGWDIEYSGHGYHNTVSATLNCQF